MEPHKTPRGRNGGRKPIKAGVQRERISVTLPPDLIRQIDNAGSRSIIIEEALKKFFQ